MSTNSASGNAIDRTTTRLKNLIASVTVVIAACTAYALTPYYRAQLDRLYGGVGFSFTGLQFLVAAACAYSVLLGMYYLFEPAAGISKSLRFWRVLGGFVRSPMGGLRSLQAPEDRLAVLATVLKGFFGPMMTISAVQSFMGCLLHAQALVAATSGTSEFLEIFNRHIYWLALNLIIFVDVAIFTVGYLVEMRSLKNEIRSVDPTLLGWAAALLCYFPFSAYVTSFVLGRQVTDFPQFEDATTHLVLNLTLLGLMAVYASASVALGLKASNLTHRGIVTKWPYSMVRHPAYLCKNLAWWIGGIPLVLAAFTESVYGGILSVVSIVGWSLLYVLRAVTEEDHLRSVDGEYDAYAQKVRYRFIPGVY